MSKRPWSQQKPHGAVRSAATLVEVLLGECKWVEREADRNVLREFARALLSEGIPPAQFLHEKDVPDVLFVGKLSIKNKRAVPGVTILDAGDVLGWLRN